MKRKAFGVVHDYVYDYVNVDDYVIVIVYGSATPILPVYLFHRLGVTPNSDMKDD